MSTFKRILSEHEYIPVKMMVVFYVVKWLYYLSNHYSFDYSYSLVEVIGYFIIYTIIRVIAQFISYNEKNQSLDVYSINSSINKKVKSLIKQFTYYENEIGVFEKHWVRQEDGNFQEVELPLKNPLELYYILNSYIGILSTIGSYSSLELRKRLVELLNKVEELLEDLDLNKQLYIHRD